jgi:hypothetical protein
MSGLRRIHYIDPYLGPLPGHWASLARSFARTMRDLGIEVRLVGHRHQIPSLLEALAVEPAFSLPPYSPYGSDPHDTPRALALFRSQVEVYASELEAVLPEDLGQEDMLFFPTIYPPILGAIARWVEGAPRRRDQRIGLLTHFADDVDVYNRARGAGGDYYYVDFYRHVLPPSAGGRAYPSWRYFSLSPGLADLYSIVLGKTVVALPMPDIGSARAIRPEAPRDPMRGPTIAILGHTSVLKGGLLLKDIVSATLREHPGVHFHLHLSTNPDTRALDAEFSEDSGRLTIRRGYLPDAELGTMLSDADIVVLPYARAAYRVMASAMFVQAAAAGKVVVLPAGTHMHRELVCHGGGYAAFGEHTASAIADALSSAIDGIDALAARARAAAPGYRARHSPAMCFKMMLDAFAGASAL